MHDQDRNCIMGYHVLRSVIVLKLIFSWVRDPHATFYHHLVNSLTVQFVCCFAELHLEMQGCVSTRHVLLAQSPMWVPLWEVWLEAYLSLLLLWYWFIAFAGRRKLFSTASTSTHMEVRTQIFKATKNSFLRWFGPKWYVVVVANIYKFFSALLSYSWTHICTNWWFEWTDEEDASSRLSSNGTKYTLAQVNAATNNNERLLGRGGFGPVYYGKLPSGQEVAVKVSAKGSAQGTREFLNEVGLFSWTVTIKGRPFMTVQVTVWVP